MAAKDIYHDDVRSALIKDGWTITHDPFFLGYGIRKLYADLGAEKLFAAEKASRKIVVEVKSFRGPSEVEDLQEACGSYTMYRNVLADTHSEWELYLAIPKDAYQGIFSEQLGKLTMDKENLYLIVFDQNRGEIIQWIS